jgi:hypothetical protein
MNRNLTLYIAGILLTLAAVAGCATTDGSSTSDRKPDASQPDKSRAAGRSSEPPNITYRPGA